MRILVLVGSGLLRTTLQEFLTHLGHEAGIADPAAGRQESPRRQGGGPDVVIFDPAPGPCAMHSAIGDLHREHPAAGILVVTQNAPELAAEEALCLGIHGYLRKPLSLRELELSLLRMEDQKTEGYG